MVSIPHRYAKNQGFRIGKHLIITLFQFLIGTLKTGLGVFCFFPTVLFQFLIGTLKTMKVLFNTFFNRWFQFLIGTLKTQKSGSR